MATYFFDFKKAAEIMAREKEYDEAISGINGYVYRLSKVYAKIVNMESFFKYTSSFTKVQNQILEGARLQDCYSALDKIYDAYLNNEKKITQKADQRIASEENFSLKARQKSGEFSQKTNKKKEHKDMYEELSTMERTKDFFRDINASRKIWWPSTDGMTEKDKAVSKSENRLIEKALEGYSGISGISDVLETVDAIMNIAGGEENTGKWVGKLFSAAYKIAGRGDPLISVVAKATEIAYDEERYFQKEVSQAVATPIVYFLKGRYFEGLMETVYSDAKITSANARLATEAVCKTADSYLVKTCFKGVDVLGILNGYTEENYGFNMGKEFNEAGEAISEFYDQAMQKQAHDFQKMASVGADVVKSAWSVVCENITNARI